MGDRSLNFSNSMKLSTRYPYVSMGAHFCSWLGSWHSTPASTSLLLIFDFLLSLRDSGLSHSSIRVYLTALSAYHDQADSFLFSPPLSKQFLKGMLHVYLPTKCHAQPRDFPLVLCCLMRPPFEPVAAYDLGCYHAKYSWCLSHLHDVLGN